MRMRSVVGVYLLAMVGCAGNGQGLDVNGRPATGTNPSSPLTADFQSIQDHVFTPICTDCHAGASAPEGLDLSQGKSYGMLVGVPSREVPSLQRVAAGDPDNSYLIHKLEGTQESGAQMPLGQPPLSADTIAVIRRWIAKGAPPPASGSATAVRVAAVDLGGAGLPPAAEPMVIVLSGDLDPLRLAPGAIELFRQGADGRWRALPVRTWLAPGDHRALLVQPAQGWWSVARYRLRLAGNGPVPVSDAGDRPLDGDGDGVPGGDFVLEFGARRR